MSRLIIFQLSALAVLVAYLCASVWLRHRAEQERLETRRKQRGGTPLDVSAILPNIERLRQDYAAVARSRARHAGYRRWLFAAAKRAVIRLPYFRNARPESPIPAEREAQRQAP